MKLKSLLLVFILICSLISPGELKSQNPYDNVSCWQWCLFIPIFIVSGIADGITEGISDSRRITINVNGVRAVFRKNTVHGYDKKRGTISSGELVSPIEIPMKGRKLKVLPGTVTFYENGSIQKCLIEGGGLLAGDDNIVPASRFAEFFDNGYLRGTFIPPDSGGNTFLIQGSGRLLRGNLFFHESGKVLSCTLGEESEFEVSDYRVILKAGSMMEFNAEGNPVYIKLPYEESLELKLRGSPVRLSGEIHLHGNGKIWHCELAESMVMLNGIHKLRVGGKILFYDNEMIKECRIVNPTLLKVKSNELEFDRIETWRREVLSFYNNGNVKSGRLTKNKKQTYRHKGLTLALKDGSGIYFYESGDIKSFYPIDGSSVNAGGINLLLRDDETFFFEEGGLLAAVLTGGSDFVYDGKKLHAGKYSSRIFFYRSGEAAAFSGDSALLVSAGSREFILPAYHTAGYSDYENGKIIFTSVSSDNIKFPAGTVLKKDDIYTYPVIFVKAGHFYNDERKEKLYASDVKEIMFSRDYTVIINGREVFCKAMEWVKISD